MEVILSNLPPPGLFLSTILGMRVLKTLLAGVALSCVTTSMNTTTQATCKERSMDGSDLVQGGKTGQPELVGCLESSNSLEASTGKALCDVLAGTSPPRMGPWGTRGFRNLSDVPVSLRDSVASPQDTSPEQICDFLAWVS